MLSTFKTKNLPRDLFPASHQYWRTIFTWIRKNQQAKLAIWTKIPQEPRRPSHTKENRTHNNENWPAKIIEINSVTLRKQISHQQNYTIKVSPWWKSSSSKLPPRGNLWIAHIGSLCTLRWECREWFSNTECSSPPLQDGRRVCPRVAQMPRLAFASVANS